MVMIVIMVIDMQEFRFNFEDAIQIKGILAQHRIQGHLTAACAMQLGIGINSTDTRLNLAHFTFAHQIHFIENDHIGKSDLVARFRRVFQPLAEPFGIHHCDHRIKPCFFRHILIDKKGLRHGTGISQARGFDHHALEMEQGGRGQLLGGVPGVPAAKAGARAAGRAQREAL